MTADHDDEGKKKKSAAGKEMANRCEQCGEELAAKNNFCPLCGKPVKNSNSVSYWVYQLNLLQAKGKIKKAIEAAKNLLQVDQQNPYIHSILGELYYQAGGHQ